MDKKYFNFHEKVLHYQQMINPNQSKFAEKAGIKKGTFNNIFKYKKNCNIDVLFKLIDTYPELKNIIFYEKREAIVNNVVSEERPEYKTSDTSLKDRYIAMLEKENQRLEEENQFFKNEKNYEVYQKQYTP